MMPIVFLDTETTGIHPEREVWEVGMIRRDDDGQRECSFFVDEVDLSKADPFGLRIGRFYDRHPNYARISHRFSTESDELLAGEADLAMSLTAAEAVERWTRGALIVGAVPNFDTEVLGAMLRRHRLTPAWRYHLIDVETLAIGYLAGRNGGQAWLGQRWKSDDLAEACGMDPILDTDRHTALGDARWVMRWYDHISGVES